MTVGKVGCKGARGGGAGWHGNALLQVRYHRQFEKKKIIYNVGL